MRLIIIAIASETWVVDHMKLIEKSLGIGGGRRGKVRTIFETGNPVRIPS